MQLHGASPEQVEAARSGDTAAAMGPLIAWGARRMSDREPTDSFHPRWAAVGMSVLADRDAAQGVRETYQFVIGRWAFHFVIDDGTIHLRDGRAEDPAVTWTTDEETWSQIASGTLTPSDAIDTGALTVQGDSRAANRPRKIFSRTRMLARAHGTVRNERSRSRASQPQPK